MDWMLFRARKMRAVWLGAVLTLPGLFALSISSHVIAHGPNGEDHKPVNIGDRNATLTFTTNAVQGDNSIKNHKISMRLYDKDADKNFNDVILYVGMYKKKKMIFRRMFVSPSGAFELILNHTGEGRITIEGKKHHGYGEGWEMQGAAPIRLSGPIFPEAGLYTFDIDVVAVDSFDNFLDWQLEFDATLSVADKTCYAAGGDQASQICVMSWYDKIEKFSYFSENDIISFSMPFDWSEKNLNRVGKIHEEIFIPSDFAGFSAGSYHAQLNGVALPDFAVMADETSDDIVVHLMIPQATLREVAEKAKGFCPGMMILTVGANDSEESRLAASRVSHCPSPPVVMSILQALGLK